MLMRKSFICTNPHDPRHLQIYAAELHRAIELKFFHVLILHIWMKNKFRSIFTNIVEKMVLIRTIYYTIFSTLLGVEAIL